MSLPVQKLRIILEVCNRSCELNFKYCLKVPSLSNSQGADPQLHVSALFLRTGPDPYPLSSQNSVALEAQKKEPCRAVDARNEAVDAHNGGVEVQNRA